MARKYFLGVTKKKKMEVIFCWNMLIEEPLFSVEKANCNAKIVTDVPPNSTAFTKKKPLVIISLKK